ncbi:MAG: copper resistance protein CopC/CopD, partial [Gemmatimonadetes bacterium]|nr:copper resistance protein CopC/CopD [Gemmatimonadota bacterium]
MPRPTRFLRFAAAALLCAAALLHAVPAAAHTRLKSSSPAAGATVGDSVTEIRLTFTEPVSAAASMLELRLGDSIVAHGEMRVAEGDDHTLVFQLPATHPAGAYRAEWHAAAADGHPVHGTLAFTVAPAARVATQGATLGDTTSAAEQAAPTAAGDTAMASDEAGDSDAASPLSVAVRWIEFLGLLGMIGAVAFHYLVVRRVRSAEMEAVADRATHGAWLLALAAAALSLVALFARLWLQSAQLFGAESAFDGELLQGLLTGTVWGNGWILQAVATIAFFIGLMGARSKYGRSVGWMGAAVSALLLAAVPALSGHAAAAEKATAVAIVSDWLHVLGAGVWLGTLSALMLAGLPAAAFAEEGKATAGFARMVGAFSPVALLGAGVAGATGVVNSLFHVTAVSQLWSTRYGA